MTNRDSFTHTRGESVYLDDIPLLAGTLFACCFDSPVANGVVEGLDLSEAERSDGVVGILTYKDITGENQIGGIIPDEPLFAEDHVHYCGMPIALVVAESERKARKAAKKIRASIKALPPITDPREAFAKGSLTMPPRTFSLGDTASAWKDCAHIFEGRADTNGQEHLYLETQGAYALPAENGALRILSSTQGPTAVQRAVCRVTGLPMHLVEVDVTRLGGGFGGKEDQANAWAALCALAAHRFRRPVKYALNRMEDMRMTGKRNPYSSDFKIGLDRDLKIVAYEVTFHQNSGAAADLSPAILERTLFHCTNTYRIPHVKATAISCKTHLPPNTAFRGFGGPQGMFVMEAAIARAAERIGVPPTVIQQRNLLRTGDEFPYGQKAVSEANECWDKAAQSYDLESLQREVDAFNAASHFTKKGIAVMPVCFGISFTNTPMNQGRALVHVYTDGSVGVSTGAVEMGQGVNTKIAQVAARLFSLPMHRVTVHSTNTYRIANTSPSAASATADLNGKATQEACRILLDRLKTTAAEILRTEAADIEVRDEAVYDKGKRTELTWKELVIAAYNRRVSLSEHAHYATPGIHFDRATEKGHPFAYHVFGTSITTVTLDCLRGTYEVDAVRIVHDIGSSMNETIDRGQIEGGLVQGIGWMTMEEVVYDREGRLRSNALSTYKVPDIYSVPREIVIEFLHSEKDNLAVFRSKAVGEPPLMYGIGAYFAIRNAIRCFNPSTDPAFDAPFTPEKVLLALYPERASALNE